MNNSVTHSIFHHVLASHIHCTPRSVITHSIFHPIIASHIHFMPHSVITHQFFFIHISLYVSFFITYSIFHHILALLSCSGLTHSIFCCVLASHIPLLCDILASHIKFFIMFSQCAKLIMAHSVITYSIF